MKTLLITLLTLLCVNTYAQSTISGKIIDQQGLPIIGANVYLKGTYDGTATNDQGVFSFETDATGIHTLISSSISF